MKTTNVLIMLLAVFLFTACNSKGDEPDKKQTIDLTFNTLVVGHTAEDVVFTQSNGQAEIDYTNMTIQFNCNFKDLDGQMTAFISQKYSLEHYKETVYYMVKEASSPYGVVIRPGLIDISTGMIWYQENNVEQQYGILIMTQYVCPYLTTTVTDENGRTYSHTKSRYVFAFDSKGEKGVMEVTDFIPETGGAIQAAVLDYEGLTVEPLLSMYTHDIGYRITADHATCRQSDYYDLTDLKINITQKGLHIKGSYKIKDKTYSMEGSVFPPQPGWQPQ